MISDEGPGEETTGERATTGDDRAREGVEHLQRAAREMIAAARAMLDVVAELVEDPATVPTLVSSLGAAARAAAQSWPFPSPERDPTGPDEPDDGPGPVERIPVS